MVTKPNETTRPPGRGSEGATSVFAIRLLHASDLEGGLDAIENAPNFAAVIDALRAGAAGAGVETPLLSAGDEGIPVRSTTPAATPARRCCWRASTTRSSG